MWSSLQEHRPSHSSSFSSPPSSSSISSSSSVLPSNKKKKKSMEEVWREINLPPAAAPSSSFRRPPAGMLFQDFLAGGPMEEAPSVPMGPPLPPFPLPPPPPTALSLNISSGGGGRRFLASTLISDHAIASPAAVGIFSFCPGAGNSSPDGFGRGDQRHKRMMKNRESAARSRARKQAYTNELELEVAHLLAENEKLRNKCQELSSAMAAQQPKKTTLQRTLTAPF